MCNALEILIFFATLFQGAEAKEFVTLPEVTIEEVQDPLRELEVSNSESFSKRIILTGKNSKPLSQVLSQMPFVQMAPNLTASASPRISLRGFDPSQTLIFIEGVPLTEPAFQSDSLSTLPKLAPKEAILFPEGAPVSLLQSSLGGAINFHLGNGQKKNQFTAQVGNLGSLRLGGQSQLVKGLGVDLEYEQAQESFRYFDDNSTPFNLEDDSWKERANNQVRRFSFLPSGYFRFSPFSDIRFFSLNSFQAADVPGPSQNPDPHHLKEWNSLTGLKTSFQLADNVRVDNSAFFRIRADDLEKIKPLEKIRKKNQETSRNYTGGGHTSFEWKEQNTTNMISLGVTYSQYDFAGGVDGETKGFSMERLEFPGALSSDIALGQFHLKPAILVSVLGSSWMTSPRLGFEYQLNSSWKVYGFGGSLFRRPSLSENYGNQKELVGNPGLLPETAKKVEIGFEWLPRWAVNGSEFQVTYSAFAAEAQNLIYLSQLGPDQKRAENIGKASWLGQELTAGLETESGFFFRPSVLWLWTRNESPLVSEQGKQLPFRFPLVVRSDLGIQKESWSASHRVSFFSSSFVDKANYEKLGSYYINDLFVGFKSKSIGQLELGILNVLDITLARTQLGGVEVNKSISGIPGYPVAGRRVGVTWIYDL